MSLHYLHYYHCIITCAVSTVGSHRLQRRTQRRIAMITLPNVIDTVTSYRPLPYTAVRVASSNLCTPDTLSLYYFGVCGSHASTAIISSHLYLVFSNRKIGSLVPWAACLPPLPAVASQASRVLSPTSAAPLLGAGA
ncbi:hypothetical protein J6590_079472 [Homalodisca vitripennis]|nr:hypothetical protein J6590_079472 [Homalodisca vitripennis]